MISRLKGQIVQVESDTVTVDISGVGYEVHASLQVLSELVVGNEITLLIYTHVREDAFTLFGFLTSLEKQLFMTLIKVNGVGPKMALSILSGAPVSKILEMIESEDVKGLCGLPKVGKKTAEQLILSLKGKLPKQENAVLGARSKPTSTKQDIVSALVNLGFRLPDVEIVVQELAENVSVEEGVRKGLTALSQR